MIQKIKTFFRREQATEIPGWPKVTEKLECAINDSVVDCKELQENYEEVESTQEDTATPYTGVFAPNYLVHDDWFPNPYMKEREVEFAGNYPGPLYAPYSAVQEFKKDSITIGDDGMHQKMYEMSTRSGTTTLQLNPIGGSENFQGGSENVHR